MDHNIINDDFEGEGSEDENTVDQSKLQASGKVQVKETMNKFGSNRKVVRPQTAKLPNDALFQKREAPGLRSNIKERPGQDEDLMGD
jgi:hypothetical protein